MLEQCPRDFVSDIADDIMLATWAMKGQWPVEGGMLAQSAWFVDLVQKLDSYQNQIDAERAERARRNG